MTSWMSLLFGHFLGDFYFQWDRLAREKQTRWSSFLIHCLTYGICMGSGLYLWTGGFPMSLCLLATLIHGFIDLGKRLVQNRNRTVKKKGRGDFRLFLLDQGLHLFTLFLLFLLVPLPSSQPAWLAAWRGRGLPAPSRALPFLTGILFLGKPCAIGIRLFLQRFSFQEEEQSKDDADTVHAGATIGILERMILFFLGSLSQYTAIAFVLTAKSVARFDRIQKDRAFAEYYLIGTLTSSLLVLIATRIF